jgi:YD repeat-containing protein
MTNSLNQVTTYLYDEQNHLKKINHPKVTKVFYDQEIARQPEVVQVTEVSEYNELGQKIGARDGNGFVTKYEYDAVGRIAATIDPKNNQLKVQK